MRFIILHSFGRTSQDNWYQSVGAALADFGTVTIPDLPDPDSAPIDRWLESLRNLQPDQSTVLIGHSLGGTLILRYLEAVDMGVHSFYLVGAPVNDLARNDLHATGFFERDFDWPKIKAASDRRIVMASKDDPTVPFWQAEYLEKQLEATLVSFTNKGHFKENMFPELSTSIKEHL